MEVALFSHTHPPRPTHTHVNCEGHIYEEEEHFNNCTNWLMYNRLTNNWWMKFHCKPKDLETRERWDPQGYQHSKAGRTRTAPQQTHASSSVTAAVPWATSHANPEASAKGLRQLCKHSLPFVQLPWSGRAAYSQGSSKWISFSIPDNVIRIRIFFISPDFVTLNIYLLGWIHLLLSFAAKRGE